MTSNAGASRKSASETIRPSVSGRAKSGAGVPSSSIVDGTATMSVIPPFAQVPFGPLGVYVNTTP
ncbi:MAG TPA: hypothetical protein VNI61_10870 [Gemmatimonadales bacterium]|nr:hypothetical protein [Gemmatimonadales bacterium]